MVEVKEFKRLMEKYSNEVDFLVIYIREAHPINGWSFANNKYQIYDHKSLEERILAARIFADDAQVKCPVVVDNMNDEAAVQYAALPERLYILQDNLIKYDGARGPFGYNLSEMEESLKNCFQKV